jgi:protein TonB
LKKAAGWFTLGYFMKKLILFILISLLFHSVLLLVKLATPLPSKPTVVEIVSRDPVEPQTPEPPREVSPPESVDVPDIQPPDHIIPNTPEPDTSVPVRMEGTPSPNLYDPEPTTPTPEPQPTPEPPAGAQTPPDTIDTTEPEVAIARPAIVPIRPDPDNPPAPYSISEFLEEQNRQDSAAGPNRRAEDIIKDWLDTNPMLGPGEDEVTFSNMNAKYDSYFYKFGRSLYGTWQYPPEAAARGESGIVRVKFSIMPDGTITNINLVNSSGYPALDREVMRTLRGMNTVPLPPSYGLKVLHVNGHFIYSLTGEYRLY